MPNWQEVAQEIEGIPKLNPLDMVREKYLSIMHNATGRNIIAYYSGWIQRHTGMTGIDENDKNGFMQMMHGLDRSKGLDLILHTPGGDLAATESLIDYLHAMFGKNVRAFVPQIAMSGGTLIALSCKEIVMGKQSCLGPFDPILNGMSCEAIKEEFERALDGISSNPKTAPIWQTVVSKYPPTALVECEKAIQWARTIAERILKSNMLSAMSAETQQATVQRITDAFGHKQSFAHSRHFSPRECGLAGLKIIELESLDEPVQECKDMQDCVLTIHHAYMHTFAAHPISKIIENHTGSRMLVVPSET